MLLLKGVGGGRISDFRVIFYVNRTTPDIQSHVIEFFKTSYHPSDFQSHIFEAFKKSYSQSDFQSYIFEAFEGVPRIQTQFSVDF